MKARARQPQWGASSLVDKLGGQVERRSRKDPDFCHGQWKEVVKFTEMGNKLGCTAQAKMMTSLLNMLSLRCFDTFNGDTDRQ